MEYATVHLFFGKKIHCTSALEICKQIPHGDLPFNWLVVLTLKQEFENVVFRLDKSDEVCIISEGLTATFTGNLSDKEDKSI